MVLSTVDAFLAESLSLHGSLEVARRDSCTGIAAAPIDVCIIDSSDVKASASFQSIWYY